MKVKNTIPEIRKEVFVKAREALGLSVQLLIFTQLYPEFLKPEWLQNKFREQIWDKKRWEKWWDIHKIEGWIGGNVGGVRVWGLKKYVGILSEAPGP